MSESRRDGDASRQRNKPAAARDATTAGPPMKLNEAVGRLLESLDTGSPDLLATVFQRWREVVGPNVAEHCRPEVIKGTELVVVATDPVWASEIRWLAPELVARINKMSSSDALECVTVRVVRR